MLGYIIASHQDEPIWIYTTNKAPKHSRHHMFKKKKADNNRFVFQRRGSGALQLAGHDKYLHVGPKEGQATATLLSQTGCLCSDEASVLLICWQLAGRKLSNGGNERDRSWLKGDSCVFVARFCSCRFFILVFILRDDEVGGRWTTVRWC